MRHSLRDEESSGGGTSLLDSIGDILEDGETKMGLASLLGIRTTNDLGACILLVPIRKMYSLNRVGFRKVARTVFNGLFGMETAQI